MMNLLRRQSLLGLSLLVLAAVAGYGRVSVADLRCEYRANPEGIGELKPRLGWILQADANARGVRQSAYQILVATTRERLTSGKADMWDTGQVKSDAMQQIVYDGQPLTARQSCWWKVRVWDQDGRASDWSAPAHWSIGLLGPADWKAEWIGLDATPPNDGSVLDDAARERLARQKWVYADTPPSKTAPVSAYLRGTFTVPAGRTITKAALAASVDQVATVLVNGRSAGVISRWEQIAPVEITRFVKPGQNVIGLEITQRDGYVPAALGEIELRLDDGSEQVLPIDTTWRFAMKPTAGWAEPGFSDESWKPVVSPPMKRNPWDGPPQTFTYWLPPAPYVRKDFAVTKPVRRAMLYVTALGAYEMELNGARVGHDHLTPGWTDFHKRVQYQTYDVTAQVRRGENALGGIIGDGWYASVLGYTGRRYFYGGHPRLLAQLEIEYADGTRATVATDGSWRGAFGAIRHADIMAGCAYDARLAWSGWSAPGFNDREWQGVATGVRPIDPAKPLAPFVVEPANADPTRVSDELPARALTEPRPGAWTFDLGQNMVGWVRLKVRGQAGQKIMVRHGEMLNPNGTLYTSNLRGANAVDVYWLRGGGEELLEPYFTFHGFRYVEVTGLDAKPELGDVTGIVVHSAMDRTGSFECSSPLVNQLVHNVIWGQKGNYLEVPTDCPQRDERAGWTGDAEFFIRAGSYNFNIAGFFTRWLETLVRDTQLPSGAFGNVAPLFGTAWTSAGWSDSALVCTYTMYRVYGDTRIVERNFDAMNRYMAWVADQTKDGVVALRGRGIGDHLNLDGGAPTTEIETAYHAYLAGAMADMAKAIGRGAEADRYATLAEQERAAFQRAFVAEDGTIKNSHQVAYALAFAWDLLTPDIRPKVADKFVALLAGRDWHLGTGFVGTPRLLPALHNAGRDEAAYRVLLQETFPSWLFQVKNGATTVWERWDGWTPEKGFQTIAMNSFNHYSFGSVAEYLYRDVAGIDTDAPGYRTIVIAPAIADGLTWAHASYRSISGRIESGWKREGNRLHLAIDIPANTTATVRVPAANADTVQEGGQPAARAKDVRFERFENGAAVYRVGSGKYVFTSEMAPK
ncbi:MAG TPA: family 78 glycoside hydrolase catalytic domain [Opitutaceae bacterium]|nr:family 78 glycoside hydrolase catalytic domain [Opitutaceae bacterium]